ncbi:alcohol dehydrogenase YqhD [Janthinobacterium agaricidamnosum NBRC 102515 = DSM 9628]|uniref:Alcohol dehydrogenase YqhD n=2 Tax=Janthinobacterium agaricidamnosum TaxID=55508 RepID=W0VB26_9BURK|nr:alcohol dehydrogenase YqhD [Janthinobacterium agaricidamnosum NBRC 102515 = DSM 9628]
MNNFIYHRATRLLFGEGQIAAIADEIPAGARLMITYGGGSIQRNGVLEQVHKALAGRFYVEFGGIEPNPAYETLIQAVELARAENIDFILAVGGGSVVDGSKFIAGALRYAGEPWDILASRTRLVFDAVPFGCVLTLPATGSEFNAGAVISRRATGDKLDFHSPNVIPRFSVLDPATTYSLPVRQVSNGVVDAFVHTTEQYLTYPVGAKVQDRFAEGLLLTLIEDGPRALSEPRNYAVRANLMWAATMALGGTIGAGVPQDWASHMIGHELTAMHGIDHAQSLAVVLPSLLRHKRHAKHAKLLQYAERVWGITGGSEEERVEAGIRATEAFFEQMQMPTRFSGYGIDGSQFPALLAKLEEHGMTALGERRDIHLDDCQAILQAAL